MTTFSDKIEELLATIPVSSDQDDRRVTSTDALRNLSTPEPFALTDANITALEKAIRAEGFEILTDPETGEVKLTQQAKS